MTIHTIDDAKHHALKATNKYLGEEEARRKIEDYKTFIVNSSEHSQDWKEEIASLEDWLASSTFKNGEHPQGIDDLVLDLVEWRSLIYAFDEIELTDSPFKKHRFYAQWISGAGYAVFCIIGKLVSTDDRDNSIKQLWKDIHEFMIANGSCSEEEVLLFNQKLSKDGHFKRNSRAILFRNKAIAHNEASPQIQWSDVDEDIALLVRAWSLVVSFCSFGIVAPFVSAEAAFSGLESVVSPDELCKLRGKRQEYLEKVRLWSRTNIATEEVSHKATAFAEFSISFGTVKR